MPVLNAFFWQRLFLKLESNLYKMQANQYKITLVIWLFKYIRNIFSRKIYHNCRNKKKKFLITTDERHLQELSLWSKYLLWISTPILGSSLYHCSPSKIHHRKWNQSQSLTPIKLTNFPFRITLITPLIETPLHSFSPDVLWIGWICIGLIWSS